MIDAARASSLACRERVSSIGERTLRSFDSDLRGWRAAFRGTECLRVENGGEIERGGVDDEGELSSSHSGGAVGNATVPEGGAIHTWLLEAGKPSSSGIGVGIGLPFVEATLLVVIMERGARMLNI